MGNDEGEKLGGVDGVERADAAAEAAAMNERLATFVADIETAEPRKVAADDGCLYNRTYRLPDVEPAAPQRTPADYRAAFTDLIRDAEAAGVSLIEPTAPLVAAGIQTGGGPKLQTGAVDARRALSDGQVTRAGLEPDIPGVAPLRIEPADPVRITEQAEDAYSGRCLLCPDHATAVVKIGTNPGQVRGLLSEHMRGAHDRSPWPGAS